MSYFEFGDQLLICMDGIARLRVSEKLAYVEASR